MAISKYQHLNRVLKAVQRSVLMPDDSVDGLIGKNTEKAVGNALAGFDGVGDEELLEYLADYPHRHLEQHEPVRKMPKLQPGDPHWLTIARSFQGLAEIPGQKHNPQILEFWRLCHLPFVTDEVAWCAGFVGGVLEKAGIQSTRSGMARSYLRWGERIKHPRLGSIAVFWRVSRRSASGHVAFVCDRPYGDFIPVLGGNQSDKVCVKRYPLSRLLEYRWPKGH